MFDLSMSVRVGIARVDVSQRQMATDIGMNYYHLNKICKGHANTRLDGMKTFAEYFGVPLSTFIGWGEYGSFEEETYETFQLTMQEDG